MINFQIQCRRSKVTAKGTARVEIAVNDGNRRIVISTDHVYDPNLFERERSQKRMNQARRIIEALSEDMNNRIVTLRKNGIPVTSENLKNIDTILYKKTTHDLKTEYLNTLKPRVGNDLTFSQYRKYEQVLSDIASIGKRIEDLTTGDLETLNAHYANRYKASTLAGFTAKIKTVIQYAHNRGYIHFNPSATLKVRKTPENVVTITEAEYARIKSKTLSGRLEKVRDALIFMCSTGLSYIDFATFDPESLMDTNGQTIYTGRRVKTKVEFYSVLLPDAMDILRKYDGDLKPIMLSNQKYNAYLKEIADICGITIPLTCHRARHFYARKLLMSNIPETVISKCLGHSNLTQTSHYIRLLKSQNVQMISEAFNRAFRKAE